jgi:hypothetical protein
VEALYATVHPTAARHYHSFFSSELGGIVTESALMVVPIDDHLVHRGHGIFDTAELTYVSCPVLILSGPLLSSLRARACVWGWVEFGVSALIVVCSDDHPVHRAHRIFGAAELSYVSCVILMSSPLISPHVFLLPSLICGCGSLYTHMCKWCLCADLCACVFLCTCTGICVGTCVRWCVHVSVWSCGVRRAS